MFVFLVMEKVTLSPDPSTYRLHMAYKEGVSTLTDVRPPLPPRATFEHGPAFRDYLLTKRNHFPFPARAQAQ